MIVHQHQGKNECLLTTVAMLAACPLDTVRAFVLRFTGRPWQDVFDGREEYARVAHEVVRQFLGTQVAARYSELLGSVKSVVPCGGRPGLPYLRQCPAGRGMLAVVQFDRWGRATRRHIMPFENGLVYDPSRHCATPYTWAEFRRVYRNWRVERVQQVQED